MKWMLYYTFPLMMAGLLGCESSGRAAASLQSSHAITDIRPGEFKKYMNSVGDTWDPAWADDGNLYTPSNDGSGWNGACASNTCFNRITGDDFRNLIGKTVNPMTGFGKWGQEDAQLCNWKASSCVSIDGVLYLTVARNIYGDKAKDPFRRQTAQNSSIIKSTDHGLTWSRTAQQCSDEPMFRGSRFGAPYFVYYGKDGAAPHVDNADQYIYATSNNGFWNNGDNYRLARVKRSDIAKLNAADWQYYKGGDGMTDAAWSSDFRDTAAIIDNPLRCGMTGATYIPSIGRYVLVAWYYPADSNLNTDETRLVYYESPHPWGPWNIVREDISAPAGWYSPRVLSKWQTGKKDGADAVMIACGDYWETPWYRFTVMPVELKTDGKFPPPAPSAPQVMIRSTQTGEGPEHFNYHGSWKYVERDKDMEVGQYVSAAAGDSFSITFTGTQVRWYSSKEYAGGIAKVSIDGRKPETEDLSIRFPNNAVFTRLAFDSGKLEPGQHTLTVTVTGQKNKRSTGTLVGNDRVEITR